MKNDPVLLYSIKHGIARITLNRPARLNALTRDMLLLLHEALNDAAQHKEVRLVTLTGAGRGFSAGQDLTERDPRKQQAPLDLESLQKELFHPVISSMTNMQKPVVAFVNGIAAGAAASIALAADIVIAKNTADFSFPFVKIGLSVDAGGGYQLLKALGPARARALLMLGGHLPADEAAACGLIWKSVSDARFADECRAIEKQLAQAPATALACIKQAVSKADSSPDLQSYLRAEARLQGIAGRDADYAEGVLAFLEKRVPKF